jgi:hypothetical protein
MHNELGSECAQMSPSGLIGFLDCFGESGIGNARPIKITFKNYVSPPQFVEYGSEFPLVLTRLKGEFYPGGLLRAGCVNKRAHIESIEVNPPNFNEHFIALFHSLLQVTERFLECRRSFWLKRDRNDKKRKE